MNKYIIYIGVAILAILIYKKLNNPKERKNSEPAPNPNSNRQSLKNTVLTKNTVKINNLKPGLNSGWDGYYDRDKNYFHVDMIMFGAKVKHFDIKGEVYSSYVIGYFNYTVNGEVYETTIKVYNDNSVKINLIK